MVEQGDIVTTPSGQCRQANLDWRVLCLLSHPFLSLSPEILLFFRLNNTSHIINIYNGHHSLQYRLMWVLWNCGSKQATYHYLTNDRWSI